MRLGLSSFACAWAVGLTDARPARPLTAFGLLDRAAELGVKLVQYGDNLPPPIEDAERLARRAQELGIAIELGTRGIHPSHLKSQLHLAQRLGASILRLVVDQGDHRPSPAEIVQLLRPVLPGFVAAGVVLAIENHDRFRSATLAGLVCELDSPAVGVCLDTVNSLGALEGPAVVLAELGPLAVNLHVKDFRVRRVSSQMGFTVEGAPAGEGDLDIPWVLGEIKRHGRDPNAILELWPPRLDSLEATMAQEAAWVQASVQNLRKWIPS